MQLLLFQVAALLRVQLHKVMDKVQIVTWGDGHRAASALRQSAVRLVQRLVDVHAPVDDGIPVGGRIVDERTSGGEKVRRRPGWFVQVDTGGELFAHLEQGRVGPIAEPVEHATIEQGGGGRGTILQAVRRWVHREDDVQIAHDLLREPLVQLVAGIQHESLALGSFLALGHQSGVLVSFEQTGHFSVGQQRVHAFQEARV